MTPSPGSWAEALSADEVEEVRSVVAAATTADGVSPLSEDFLLRLGRPGRHLRVDGGYAQLADDGAAELVVAPEHRGEGEGRRLVEAVLDRDPAARLWAHGDLPAARAVARTLGLLSIRTLLVLRRPLAGVPDAPPAPEGFRVRPFVPGADDAALLAVNAAAFADHPEQGRLDQLGLETRMAQPWFDPAGFFVVEDGAGEIAAFHWTKVADPTSSVGEVYVVGVPPAHQGHGLGGYVTAVGLAHLRDLGLGTAELYVEGDNTPALATYRRAGMSEHARHVMYALPGAGSLPQ